MAYLRIYPHVVDACSSLTSSVGTDMWRGDTTDTCQMPMSGTVYNISPDRRWDVATPSASSPSIHIHILALAILALYITNYVDVSMSTFEVLKTTIALLCFTPCSAAGGSDHSYQTTSLSISTQKEAVMTHGAPSDSPSQISSDNRIQCKHPLSPCLPNHNAPT